jgi:predicted permease
VFAVCFVVALLTGALFALAFSWYSRRRDPCSLLRYGTAAALGRSATRVRRWLIIAQVALSLVLLTCAGLFARTLENLRSIHLGFDAHNVALVMLIPTPSRSEHPEDALYHQQLAERLGSLPGVIDVSVSHFWPGNRTVGPNVKVTAEFSGGQAEVSADFAPVSPGFFKTMGLTLLQGRDFTWHDTQSAPGVAVLTASLARSLFPQGHALGQKIRARGDKGSDTSLQVIGVTADSRIAGLRESRALVLFVPEAQWPDYIRSPIVEIKTSGKAEALGPMARRSLESLARNQVLMVQTADQLLDSMLLPERINAFFSEIFSILALFLTCMGIYGLIAYVVLQRTQEIGIRAALGASARSLIWMIVRDNFLLLILGCAVGVPIGFWATRLTKHMLFGVSPNSYFNFITAAAALMVAGGIASYVPARRATRVDPASALRAE